MNESFQKLQTVSKGPIRHYGPPEGKMRRMFRSIFFVHFVRNVFRYGQRLCELIFHRYSIVSSNLCHSKMSLNEILITKAYIENYEWKLPNITNFPRKDPYVIMGPPEEKWEECFAPYFLLILFGTCFDMAKGFMSSSYTDVP